MTRKRACLLVGSVLLLLAGQVVYITVTNPSSDQLLWVVEPVFAFLWAAFLIAIGTFSKKEGKGSR